MDVRLSTKVELSDWSAFVSAAHPSFLVTPEWAGFQAAAGHDSFSISGKKKSGEEVVLSSLVVRQKLKLGLTQLLSSFGPWLHPLVYQDETVLQDLLKMWVAEVKSNALRSDVFVRIEPGLELGTKEADVYVEALKLIGARKAPRGSSPQHTSIVDLTVPEKERLARMHPKSRYNVRLSKRKGVEIQRGSSREAIEKFLLLYHETTSRQEFHGHSDDYYRLMLETLAPSGTGELFLAMYKGVALAGAIVLFTPTRATYLHGASSHEQRKVMAPHLLHEEIIREALRRECKEYDFWGVAPKDAGDDHPWAGISRFKRGFGGRDIALVPAYDIPLRLHVTRLLHAIGK